MRKTALMLIMVLCVATAANAQDYNTGIGLTGGMSQNFTIKHFFNRTAAFEGLLSTHLWAGFETAGLFEIHNEAFDAERLKWYFGGGSHIGFWNGNHSSWLDDEEDDLVFGIDGIIGIEYSFREAPINIGTYCRPKLNFVGNQHFFDDYGSIVIRYIF